MKPQDVSAMRSALAAALLDADLRFTHERAGIDLIDQIMLIFRQHDGHDDFVRAVKDDAVAAEGYLSLDGPKRNWLAFNAARRIVVLCDAELAKGQS